MQLECREVLRRLDPMDKPWVQVVVVWNRQDTQLQADALVTLDTNLARRLEGIVETAPIDALY